MLKIGLIKEINAAPITYGLIENPSSKGYEIVFGKVTELNSKIKTGDIDISIISSFEYARNSELYYILPKISISSDGPVRSIILFLERPIESLRNCSILMPKYSLTSVHLVQYLLKDRQISFVQHHSQGCLGKLLIADEAIQYSYDSNTLYRYDLGELWGKEIALPFVYALCVVRRDSYKKNLEEVHHVYRELLKSKEESISKYEEIAKKFYQKVFPSFEPCVSYLKNLRYDFSGKYQEGFLHFQQEMVKLRNLDRVPPLCFLPKLV